MYFDLNTVDTYLNTKNLSQRRNSYIYLLHYKVIFQNFDFRITCIFLKENFVLIQYNK